MWVKIFAHILNDFLFYADYLQINKTDMPIIT